jgi:hypothetical protein
MLQQRQYRQRRSNIVSLDERRGGSSSMGMPRAQGRSQKTSGHLHGRAAIFGVIDPLPVEPHYYHKKCGENPSNSNICSSGGWSPQPFGKKLRLAKTARHLSHLSHLS